MKRSKNLVAIIACGLLAFPAPAQAANERGGKTKTTTSAPASEASPECHAMAKLFEITICQEQLSPHAFNKKRYSSPNAKQDPQEFMLQMTLLRRAIWQTALIHKFGDAAAPPTMEEIDNYRKGFNQSMDASYEADRKTVDYIKSLLDKYTYSAENEQKLKQLLEVTQSSLKLYSERQQHTEGLPKEYKFVVDTAERGIARNMLTTWKNDKLLFNAYRGHLALTAGNVVPVDAYKEFLKYIRVDGKLTISDPQYATVLDEIEKMVNESHDYLPGGDEIAKKYFTSPDWQFSLANSSARFKDLQDRLAKIPNRGPKTDADVKEHELIGKQSEPASQLPSITSGSGEIEKKN